MEPTSFDDEWIKAQAIIEESFIAYAGKYCLTKDAMQLLCRGMFAARELAGMDYAISKLK